MLQSRNRNLATYNKRENPQARIETHRIEAIENTISRATNKVRLKTMEVITSIHSNPLAAKNRVSRDMVVKLK
jgi:hypothetical protein